MLMPRYRIMVEETRYVTHFKVFEAASIEEAEHLALEEVEAMAMGETLTGQGWRAGDSTSECEVKPDVSEELS
jgi:hypothetical protein